MKPILVVDDDRNMREAMKATIERAGYPVEITSSPLEALDLIDRKEFSLVITDMKMPGMSGLELLKQIRLKSISVPVLVITGFGTVENAVECMKLGASDYIMKPFDFKTLIQAIKRLTGGNEDSSNTEIITRDERMLYILRLAGEIAKTDTTVLITGESGTGKELLARYIHKNSNRSERRFVAVNCAAIPENLLESELFGHEKGAFTGATERKLGKFELANGGTLLLDEIGEMPPALQAKLLRVLQEREIDRLGSKEPVPVDIRVIATTNKNLTEEVEKGNFRADLYYRLSVFPIELPPLRERPADISLLAEHFMRLYSRQYGKPLKAIDQDAQKYLLSRAWKGNVRELENVIQRAVIMCQGELLTVDALKGPLSEKATTENSGFKTLKEMEKEMILRTLKATEGNRTRAAEVLGISVRTLRNKLNEYALEA